MRLWLVFGDKAFSRNTLIWGKTKPQHIENGTCKPPLNVWGGLRGPHILRVARWAGGGRGDVGWVRNKVRCTATHDTQGRAPDGAEK